MTRTSTTTTTTTTASLIRPTLSACEQPRSPGDGRHCGRGCRCCCLLELCGPGNRCLCELPLLRPPPSPLLLLLALCAHTSISKSTQILGLEMLLRLWWLSCAQTHRIWIRVRRIRHGDVQKFRSSLCAVQRRRRMHARTHAHGITWLAATMAPSARTALAHDL